MLTSISPCPLATNIAAISYISKRVGNTRAVFLSGALYTLGRMLAYMIVGAVLVAGILSVPEISQFLQKYMNRLLGPILIVAGMFMLELISFAGSGSGVGEKMKGAVERSGIWGAFLLGAVFALSFCPLSAALFFGSLIPLAVKHESTVILPLIYGLGTGLPVLVFAALIAGGAHYVGGLFNAITRWELWARRITGTIFILVGLYYTLIYIFKFNL
ncbi:MAG: sulfite exporter TauE/SafE family protein [FCB group bacterium]|nr:sulfite exporter TauE/SafE family protein [FCB group bacterium]